MSNTPNEDISPSAWGQANPFPTSTGGTSSGSTGLSEGYIPPNQRGGRTVEIEPGKAIVSKPSSTPGIVNPDGSVTNFYDLRTKPGELLGSLNDIARNKLVKTLYSRGWYGGKKMEGGMGDNDVDAVKNLLYYANVKGVSWDTVLNTIAQAPISAGASGGGVTVANTADLIEVANRTALSTIGRKLSEDEAAKFASAYQGAQRASATGSMSAPSADVYFQNRIQNQYGAESDGYKYLTAISNVAKLMESM